MWLYHLNIHARYLFRVLIHHVRFEVLSAVLLRIQVFLVVTLFHWAHISKHFERSHCLHLQCHADEDEDIWSFNISETTHQSAQCHIPEYLDLWLIRLLYTGLSDHCENWIWFCQIISKKVCPMHVSSYAIAQEIKLLASCGRVLGINPGYSVWVVWWAEW